MRRDELILSGYCFEPARMAIAPGLGDASRGNKAAIVDMSVYY